MNGSDFLQMMNDLDADLLEAADVKPAKRKNYWIVPAAACLCLFLGLGIILSQNRQTSTTYQNTLVAFSVGDKVYEMPGLNDYVRLGLINADDYSNRGMTVRAFTKEDLGSSRGEVYVNLDGKTVSCRIYSFKSLPDDENVCIIELPGDEYQLYIVKE